MIVVPGYSGFKPVEDDKTMPTNDLIVGRRSFFPEGDKITDAFLTEYKKKRKQHYDDRRELKSLFKKGFILFIFVHAADILVSSL